MSWSTPRRS